MKKEMKLIIALLAFGTSCFMMSCEQTLSCPTGSDNTMTYLDEGDLITFIQNYRDKDWCETSVIPTDEQDGRPNRTEILNAAQLASAATNNGVPTDNFDARFVDFDLKQLKNYICQIEASENAQQINTLRFYYIKYTAESDSIETDYEIPTKYQNKHSLAIVPVITNEDETEEEILTINGQTIIANHGHMHPPKPVQNPSMMLLQAD